MGEWKSWQREGMEGWSQKETMTGKSISVDGWESLHSENTTAFEVVRDDLASENWATDGDEWNSEFAKSLRVKTQWQGEWWSDQ